jgi:hypothetical protein
VLLGEFDRHSGRPARKWWSASSSVAGVCDARWTSWYVHPALTVCCHAPVCLRRGPSGNGASGSRKLRFHRGMRQPANIRSGSPALVRHRFRFRSGPECIAPHASPTYDPPTRTRPAARPLNCGWAWPFREPRQPPNLIFMLGTKAPPSRPARGIKRGFLPGKLEAFHKSRGRAVVFVSDAQTVRSTLVISSPGGAPRSIDGYLVNYSASSYFASCAATSGSTRVPSAFTASSASGSSPSAFKMVGAT